MARSGLMLVNMGTPSAPSTSAVRRYLRQFLGDWRVIDMARWKRELILNLFILPRRPARSARLYKKIWKERSPLLSHGEALTRALQQLSGEQPVVLGMRYGQPSIDDALDRLVEQGVDRVVALPLYPQYAPSTTGSAVEALGRAVGQRWNTPYLQVVPAFYDHPRYIDCLRQTTQEALQGFEPEVYLFSFHGLPERHCKKGDESHVHCLERADCCDQISSVNQQCYRAQCFATARALAHALKLSDDGWRLSFQSRFGRERWLEPATDEVALELARQHAKVALVAPSFVADCLETLEELGVDLSERFLRAGGDGLKIVPSLNADPRWAEAVYSIAKEGSSWIV